MSSNVSTAQRWFLLALLAGATSAQDRLEVIELPVGFQPEGITFERDWTAFVGSLADGSIWKGDLDTGVGEVVITAGVGDMALGMDFDSRTDYLYVAGGPSGTIRIYDSDYNLLLEPTVGAANGTSFINDLIIGDDSVYITDSFRSQFYVLPLTSDGELQDGAATQSITVPISGDGFPPTITEFVSLGESILSNGIEVSDDGSMLIIAVTGTSELYLVDAETGAATLIDLGGDAVAGDGLLRRRNTLWVVENGLTRGNQTIHEIVLSEDWTCGEITRYHDNELLNTPSTAARRNNGIYTVNARFLTETQDVPTQTYEIIRVDRDEATAMC